MRRDRDMFACVGSALALRSGHDLDVSDEIVVERRQQPPRPAGRLRVATCSPVVKFDFRLRLSCVPDEGELLSDPACIL